MRVKAKCDIIFQRLWRAIEHTAYAQVTKWVLKTVYGELELTRDALERVAAQLPTHDQVFNNPNRFFDLGFPEFTCSQHGSHPKGQA